MSEREDFHAHKKSRGRPGHSRLYYHLGVRDLREIIDRKRSERGHATEESIPPPNPSYNYLKDPQREGSNNNPPIRQNYMGKYYNKNNANYNHGGNQSYTSKNRDIENPLNIKVVFSTSTGEHVYKMDESTVLPTIKHVPDQLPPQNRPFRGRGRGRGRGQRHYHTKNTRNNVFDQKPDSQEVSQEHQPDENWDDDPQQTNEENVEDKVHKQDEVVSDSQAQFDDPLQEDNSLEKNLKNLQLDKGETTESDEKIEEPYTGKKTSH